MLPFAPIALLLPLLAPGPAVAPTPGTGGAQSARPPAPPILGPFFDALLGDWAGEGRGVPGSGGGTASFRFDLEKHVLVRRSQSDFPAAEGRPATHHEDLMVVSAGPSPDTANAVYFDNEGHVISYQASWSADGKVLTFVSPRSGNSPSFRLVYTVLAEDTMKVTFGMAQPGRDDYAEYVSGVIRRTGRR